MFWPAQLPEKRLHLLFVCRRRITDIDTCGLLDRVCTGGIPLNNPPMCAVCRTRVRSAFAVDVRHHPCDLRVAQLVSVMRVFVVFQRLIGGFQLAVKPVRRSR